MNLNSNFVLASKCLIFQPTVEFIDKISSNCRNLKHFDYEVCNMPDIDITNTYPKVSSKDEDIFPKLTYIRVKFNYDYDFEKDPSKNTALDNFTKYLTAKCPNLKGPIESNETSDGYSNIVFESFDNSESEGSIISMENE